MVGDATFNVVAAPVSRSGLPTGVVESSMEDIDMLLPERVAEAKAARSRPPEKGGGGGGTLDMDAGGLY